MFRESVFPVSLQITPMLPQHSRNNTENHQPESTRECGRVRSWGQLEEERKAQGRLAYLTAVPEAAPDPEKLGAPHLLAHHSWMMLHFS